MRWIKLMEENRNFTNPGEQKVLETTMASFIHHKPDNRWKLLAKAVLSIVLIAVLFIGCSAIGPETIDRDRFDYVTAISESWKRQTLLNLLKTRYLDAPVFMDVSSVINQYALESEIELGFSWNSAQTQSVGGRGMYTDRPTITYVPLMGEKFARSLLKPLPIAPVLLLIQSGYPTDDILRICIQSINGIDNSRRRTVGGRNDDPQFEELLPLFRRVYEADEIAMRSKKTDTGLKMRIIFRPAAGGTGNENLRRLKKLLGLATHINEFKVVHGKFALDDTEIAILSRSMLQIMTAFAACIETPESDGAGIQMNEALQAKGLNKKSPRPLIHVKNGSSKPDDAFVAVRYRHRWFWIEDQDIYSKHMFNFLMILFSFTERGSAEPYTPVLTVPTN